jgi:hypothetical protein
MLLCQSSSSVMKVLCDDNSFGKNAKGYKTLLFDGGLHDVNRGLFDVLSLYLVASINVYEFIKKGILTSFQIQIQFVRDCCLFRPICPACTWPLTSCRTFLPYPR